MGRPSLALCLVVVCATRANGSAAATCATPPGAAARLATLDGNARLQWINERLTRDATKGRRWAGAWAIGIGAAGLGSLAPVPFVAKGDRVDWYTSAATAAIGVIPFVVSPLSVTRDAPRLRDAVALVPTDDTPRVCAVLADAERKLAADAADEQWQQGWWTHAGNLAFNTGVLLFLGLGYHHWTSGLINGLSGAVVGETILFTQPTGLIDDGAAYNRGELSTGITGARAGGALGWAYGGRF
jgi:hypothetical protein